MVKFRITTLLSQVKLISAQLDKLTTHLIKLAKQMTDYDYLASVPGISETTIVSYYQKSFCWRNTNIHAN